jgi:glyoxylase-like metal-dependent hydrolase (beta-lactamase superfamily II)/ferredoxin
MARLAQRRPQNIAGDLYVDSSCIDCDTCRWMAPGIYHRQAGQSAVYHQPETEPEQTLALQALLSCPTASIGTVQPPVTIEAVQASFPILVTDRVYHCGYHAESSFGAASYFIQRPEGNVLVDSPRFAPPLVKQLEAMGGIRYLYLTHRDDVADHGKFREHFGCDRILHTDDLSPQTQGIEIPLTGLQPWQLAPDLTLIPTPGHTKGHTVLLFDNRVLFTGDHLAWSDQLQQLHAFRRACWYSWETLRTSMQALQHYRFEWILPGHGRRYHADADTMAQELEKCIAWMATVA